MHSRNPVSLSEAGAHSERAAPVVTEKLTVEIPSFVDNPIRHLAVDLHLKLTPLANEALAKFVADYTKKTPEKGGHITLPKDKNFRERREMDGDDRQGDFEGHQTFCCRLGNRPATNHHLCIHKIFGFS